MKSSRRNRRPLFFPDGWVTLLAVVVGGTLVWLSVGRYRSYNAGMLDLGNMSQAVWSATQGRALECTYGDGTLSRLAHHVELIYFLLAPLYAAFPSPITLLVLQAVLYASGSFPLFLFAHRRLQHKWAARLIVLSYLLYPVALTSVLFDFHGDTLAMPLLLFAFEAVDRRGLRAYAIWLILALACKFYVSVPVAAFGLVLYASGQRRVGAFTAIAGGAWIVIVFLVIRPHFAPDVHVPPEATTLGYFEVYFGRVRELFTTPGMLVPRLLTAFIVFAPGLWLSRFAPKWLVPAVAVGLPALATAGLVAAYDYRFHHYALVVPFILFASIEGAAHLRQRKSVHWLLDVGMQAAIVVLFGTIFVDTPLSPFYWASPPGWGRDAWAYGVTARDAVKDRWLKDNVPDAAPTMASFFLAPHLASRSVLFMPQIRDEPGQLAGEDLLDRRLGAVDYVVLDALFDYTAPSEVPRPSGSGSAFLCRPNFGPGHPQPVVGGVLYDSEAISAVLRHPDFGLADARDGLLLFTRQAGFSADRLLQQLTVSGLDRPPHVLARFSDAIGLVATDVVPQTGRRFWLEFDWVALRSLKSDPVYFAVSRLEGVQDARIVHLPTQAVYPTDVWGEADLVREAFEMEVPAGVPPGSYPLILGWYDSSHPYASFTDERSRVGREMLVAVLEVAEAAPRVCSGFLSR